MSSHPKKLAVLHCLSQESEPVDIKKILEKLGDDYPERSVRRWLAEMANEGLVEKSGVKRGMKYRIALLENRQMTAMASCFRRGSEKAIAQVRRPIYERSPVAYVDEWFSMYRPNKDFYLPEELRTKLNKVGKRFTQEEPAGTYAHQIFNRLLIDLSYNSSRLEGNTYSLIDTQKLLLEGMEAEGKLDEETMMILNHKEAIRYLVDNAPRLKITTETICTLHYLLADGLVEARYAGKVRDHGVRIGGSTYIPFEDSKQLQRRLDLIAERVSQIEDPYEQSMFLLVHVTYLQAFLDVNKRTARLCANIPLIKGNLVPVSFSDVDRGDYISAVLAIYELQDVRPMVDLYLFSYMRTCAMYDSTVKSIGFDAIRVRYRAKRRVLIREIILGNLSGESLKDWITRETAKWVPLPDREAFIGDVFEDLKEMDVSRIAGLGITPEQLNAWLKRR